jgi:hypothetical protein
MYRENQDNQNMDKATLDTQTCQQPYENFCPEIGQQCPFLAQGVDPTMTRQRYHNRPNHHYYQRPYHHYYQRPYYPYYPYYPYFPSMEYEDHDDY